MQTTVFFTLALAAALVLAAPATTSSSVDAAAHHLERRQINPISFGVGTAAVQLSRNNEKTAHDLHDKVVQLLAEASQLKGREDLLINHGPRLVRRQLGTVLGGVGIHKNKATEQEIVWLTAQTVMLRAQTNQLLVAERLDGPGMAPHEQGDDGEHAPDMASVQEAHGEEEPFDEAAEDHPRLQRRFLGIILAPIAMDKARKQRDQLKRLSDEIEHIRADLARVKTEQDVRMRLMNGGGIAMPAMNAPFLAGGRNGGVLGSFESRTPINGPTVGGFGGPRTGSFNGPNSFNGPVGSFNGHGSNGHGSSYGGHSPSHGSSYGGNVHTRVSVEY